MKNKLTQKELKRQLDYNPMSGVFTRLVSNHHKVLIGDVAGTKNFQGYIVIRVGGKPISAHRLAFLYMEGYIPKEVDHINHVRDDNRWDNLRSVTRKENCRNNSRRKDNKSGKVGVSWKNRDSVWVSQIRLDGKTIWLGQFKKLSDAVNCREEAERFYGFHVNHGVN